MDASTLALLVAIARANGSNPAEAVVWSERVGAIYDEAAAEAAPTPVEETPPGPTSPQPPAA